MRREAELQLIQSTVALREGGSCRRFVCPYHAWTYARDGSLASVRHQALDEAIA